MGFLVKPGFRSLVALPVRGHPTKHRLTLLARESIPNITFVNIILCRFKNSKTHDAAMIKKGIGIPAVV